LRGRGGASVEPPAAFLLAMIAATIARTQAAARSFIERDDSAPVTGDTRRSVTSVQRRQVRDLGSIVR